MIGFILLHRECLHNISLQPICRHLDATSAHPRSHTSDMSLLIFLGIFAPLLLICMCRCAGVRQQRDDSRPRAATSHWRHILTDVEGCSWILEHQRPHLTWEQLFHRPYVSWCSSITPVQAVKRQPSWSRLFCVECDFTRMHPQS